MPECWYSLISQWYHNRSIPWREQRSLRLPIRLSAAPDRLPLANGKGPIPGRPTLKHPEATPIQCTAGGRPGEGQAEVAAKHLKRHTDGPMCWPRCWPAARPGLPQVCARTAPGLVGGEAAPIPCVGPEHRPAHAAALGVRGGSVGAGWVGAATAGRDPSQPRAPAPQVLPGLTGGAVLCSCALGGPVLVAWAPNPTIGALNLSGALLVQLRKGWSGGTLGALWAGRR